MKTMILIAVAMAGALTAADKPGSVLTAAGASSALTASTAARSTLTAQDQRTGGPT